MQLIDLSQPLSSCSPIYPGDAPTEIVQKKILARDSYVMHHISSDLHTGTHIDAPMHLIESNYYISEFPLERGIGAGVLLDVRGESLIKMREEYELIPESAIVLLYTGFDQKYHEPAYYHEHPSVDESLADFFVERKIKMLGMDMPSPDYEPFLIHKRLMEHDILIMENLTNLERLINIARFEVIAFPLKIEAEASFVRAAAIVKDT